NETLAQDVAAARAARAAGDPQSVALRQQATALAAQLAEQKTFAAQLEKTNSVLVTAATAKDTQLAQLKADNQRLAATRADPAAQDDLTRQLAAAQQAAAEARAAARAATAAADQKLADLSTQLVQLKADR